MSAEVVVTLEDGVRTIRLNRPARKNAFNDVVYKTITKTLRADSNNDEVVVTIITGTGGYYSSGFDIKSAADGAEDEASRMKSLKDMIYAFITYPKILIALVNGPCIGIATTTAALCDIVYASDTATFETPFIKLGLCAEGCSSYTFPRIFGRSKASEILLLGKKLTAHEAYQFGFVAQVIPHEKLEAFAKELKKYGTLSVNTVKINKKIIMSHYQTTLCECCDRELEQLDECFHSEDFVNAIMNFLSKKSKL